MQLDNTRVVVRERGYLELLDLSLCVVREHFGLIWRYALAGIGPAMLLNYLLLYGYGKELSLPFADDAAEYSYVWRVIYLTLLEMPIATAPLTLCLSKVMFEDRPSAGEIARQFGQSLWQLALLRVALPALMIVPAVFFGSIGLTSFCTVGLLVLLFLRHLLRPYVGEVILLERNPLSRAERNRVTTRERSKTLHGPHVSDLFARWLLSLVFAVPWVFALWWSVWMVQGLIFSGQTGLTPAAWTVVFPACLWLIVAFFSVVRFLSYLDLRIRGEGWEVELKMRAAGEQLTRRLT